DDDQNDAAPDPRVTLRPRAWPWTSGRDRGRIDDLRLGRDSRHYSAFSATLSRAEAARGFIAASRALGRTGRGARMPNTRSAQHRLMATDADREVGRAGTAARLLPEPMLDDAVLQRVEADHGETTTRPEHLDGRRERVFERVQLLVHGDPQGLENALGRVALTEPGRRGDRRLDHVDELARALERLLPPPAPNRTSDLPCEALFPVAPEDLLELTLLRLVDELGRGDVRRGIHPHV